MSTASITRLPPEVNRFIYVKNLPFNVTNEELYELFGKYGAIRQIRLGNAGNTKGSAFVVYEDIMDAKQALEHLNGFNVKGRYLICMYHRVERVKKKKEAKERLEELAMARKHLGLDVDEEDDAENK